ncbi:hypothetical protein MMC25_007721 [Agyrium rufum]|nr:hypothetical protein [Agyrium rufum]
MVSLKFTASALVAIQALFASVTSAHMIMATPTPFGKSSINNSPLSTDGSDFPCKQRSGVYDVEGANNVMPIGVNQTLSFIGSAVHGGGSCQISLTTDKAPNASTKWMVIHSIQGGCPANTEGNLPENANGNGASTFQFSVPEGVSPGDYVLAWTWFNRIGNREMYMNCAPVTVTGGAKKRDSLSAKSPRFQKASASVLSAKRAASSSFPDMFRANIGSVGGGCQTNATFDLQFPNPGNSVQFAGSSLLLLPAGSGCQQAGAAAAPPAPPASAVASSAPAPASSPTGTPVSLSTPSGTTSGDFLQGTATPSISTVPVPAPQSSAAATTTPSAAPAASSAPMPSGGNGSVPSTGGSSSCSTPGQEVCSSDGTQIGMCDQTGHVVFMPVAAGTKCSNGMMVMAGSQKRRFVRGHVRRSHSGSMM